MTRNWRDFAVDGIRTNCGQCIHCDASTLEDPCKSCIDRREVSKSVFCYEINGVNFAPRDPEYFENLKKLLCKYNEKLAEAEAAYNAIKREISKEARELGIRVDDFYYGRHKLSPRIDDYIRERDKVRKNG